MRGQTGITESGGNTAKIRTLKFKRYTVKMVAEKNREVSNSLDPRET